MKEPAIVIVPGLGNSGPEHWQTWLENRHSNWHRLQQRDWDHAICNEWVAALDREVVRLNDNVVLVGHSCGTMTIAFWGARMGHPIKGALLVAPTDTEHPDLPAGIDGFNPIPRTALPFPSILVASRNDQYTGIQRAQQFAQDWGSELIELGEAGHINTAAGFGPWPLAEELVQRLLAK